MWCLYSRAPGNGARYLDEETNMTNVPGVVWLRLRALVGQHVTAQEVRETWRSGQSSPSDLSATWP